MEANKTLPKGGINEVFGSIAANITAVYVLVMLCVFPLYTHNQYFDILSARFTFYWVGTLATLIILALLFVVYLLIDWKENQGMYSREQLAVLLPKNLVRHMHATDWCFLVLILIMTISMIGSGYPYETFWGNRGRYQGLLCWLMYAAEYFILTRFYRFRDWHLKAFLCTGTLVCLWGITDFFRLDLFGFLSQVGASQINIFVSSIGNINTYTSFTVMIFAAAAMLFIQERKLWAVLFDFLVMAVSALACIMGVSDNVVFAYAAFFAFVPFWAWKNRQGVVRYLITAATAFTMMAVTGSLVNAGVDNISIYIGGSFFISFGQGRFCLLLSAVLWILSAVLAGVWMRSGQQELSGRVRIAWGIFCAAAALAVLAILIDANTGGHPELWQPYSRILIYNDLWGSGRGHIWRLSMKYFTQQATLFEQIFGHGPDTFYMLTVDHYLQEMQEKAGTIYDSVHNEYLNYLLTIGIAGLLAYLALVYHGIREMLAAAKYNREALVCMTAIIIYLAQAVINIAVPITLPIFFTLMAVGAALNRTEE